MESTSAVERRDERDSEDPSDVRLLGVRKTYGEVVAVERIDIEILEGEFFTLLGPSGLREDHLPAHDRRLRAAGQLPDRAMPCSPT